MSLDFKSLSVKENLNEDIWNDDKKLRPEVRKKLLRIARDFYKDLEIDWAKVKDVTFTGSLANYNWSKHSDIDLHLVVDYGDVDENIDFVEAYFMARKNLWNNMHNIEMHDFDIEVYVQNEKEPHHSSGVYSVLNDKWLIEPKKENPTINKEEIQKKINLISKLIDKVKRTFKSKDYAAAIADSEKLSDKIKKMRTCGLEEGGEFSTENLTFKLLRRKGLLDVLWNIKIDSYDKMMSI